MRIRTGIAAGLLLAVSTLGMAGCGGDKNNNDRVASVTPGATPNGGSGPAAGTERELALKFAQCMRASGVPDFPDPEFDANGEATTHLGEGMDIAKVEAAQALCKQFLPNGGAPRKIDPKLLESLRKYSQCMRDNGVANFPDPTDEGLQVNGNEVDSNDPKVQAAEKLCATHMPPPPSGAPGAGSTTGSKA